MTGSTKFLGVARLLLQRMQEFDEYMTLCGCPGEEFPQERERFVAEYLHDFATMVLRPLEAHGPSIEAYLEHCVPDLDTVPERK